MSRPWWRHCRAVKRYMPLQDGRSIQDILSELEALVDAGYGGIQITAPYDSVDFFPWWGLRARDPMRLSPVLGASIEDFVRLTRRCHELGLGVLVFLNLGYADPVSEAWKCHRFDYFRWSDTGQEPPEPPTVCFPRQERWAWSEADGGFFRCFWQTEQLAMPQYDWAKPACREYLKQILTFWLEAGVDGVIFDAVNRYVGCTMSSLREMTDLVHGYGAIAIPEGATGFSDPPLPWLAEGGFDVLEDQRFHSDLHWNGSGIFEGSLVRQSQEPGVVFWSYLSYGPGWTPRRRLQEIAVLMGTGHITELISEYLTDIDQTALEALLRASKHPALAPWVPRRVEPKNSTAWVCHCVHPTAPVWCLFWFSEAPGAVRLEAPMHDLITGEAFPQTVPMEPWGYRYLIP